MRRCALIFAAKAIVAVQLSDGHELWRVPWITKWDLNTADPIVAGDLKVYEFTQSGKPHALVNVNEGGPVTFFPFINGAF